MTQQEERPEDRGGFSATTSEFVAEGRQRIEDFADAQTQIWRRFHDSNRKWFDRMQSEASMAADFAARLSAAKSFAETASLFQNWTARHIEMAADDAQRALTDTQEILAAGARFWTKVGAGGGNGARHVN